MIIGIDFDNTIACYDGVFHKVALEKGLIPENIGITKEEVKNYLKGIGNENIWTELQGIVYGPEIIKAKVYPGVLDFLEWCKDNDIKTYIISHKTKHPFIGERHDLHAFAKKFLELKNFFTEETGLKLEETFFNETKEEKIVKVEELNCDFFIDDLPEILMSKHFPERTRGILFDPNNKNDSNACNKNLMTVNSWNDFKEFLKIAKLTNTKEVTAISGGKNNKAYKFNKADQTFFAKSYFKHANDTRDRLSNEFSFSKFLYKNNVTNIPKPISKHEEHNVGIYEFVEGERIKSNEVNKSHVNQAISFFLQINKFKEFAKHLPDASDACFSIADNISSVEKRLVKLKEIAPSSEMNSKALDFVNNTIIPKFEIIKSEILQKVKNPEEKIKLGERCISPSDFGFHNTLVSNGKVTFLDFEYAGWDDPAKMVCDFFCQPEVKVLMIYFEEFLRNLQASKHLQDLDRVKLLLPLHQIKWCCIMLNDFLKISGERRIFSGNCLSENHKLSQLNKAKKYFDDAQLIKIISNQNHQMGENLNIVSSLHKGTAREYLPRMCDDKVECMKIAKRFDRDFWDGDRRHGYGGYNYIPGRWTPVAEMLIERYNLTNGSKILDVGCGKAYLLYEFKKLLPGIKVVGFDVSSYAVANAKEEIKEHLFVQKAEEPFNFGDKEYDLVISINTLHNLRLNGLKSALQEMERVGKKNYFVTESYRNTEELFNLQCWALTAETFFTPDEWTWLFNEFNFTGDYEFVFFE
jgi:thiamine kinase-like enzyme